MLKKKFDEHGYELIYTPPYLPDVQPIEKAWAFVKNHVAVRYKNRRTMDELLAQVREGLYGDGKDHTGLTAERAESIVRHSLHCCGAMIVEDKALIGDIMTVKTSVVVSAPDSEKDTDAEMNSLDEEDESDVEESDAEEKE